MSGARLQSFFGGLALDHHKALAFARPIASAPLPDTLHLPIQGYGGVPEPELEQRLQVAPGQTVAAGALLLAHQDDAHPALHAPTDGVFQGLIHTPQPAYPGGPIHHLTIDVDPAAVPAELPGDAPAALNLPPISGEAISGEATIDALARLGVVGLGGARFPAAEKFRHAQDKVDMLIINGVGCEPYIACDEALMYARPRAIVWGAELLAQVVGAKRIVLAIEDPLADTHGALVDVFAQALDTIKPLETPVEVVKVPQRYPQGAERQLIQTLTGEEVPHAGLPQDVGVLVSNVATAASAFDALAHQRPLTHRLVTVTGPGVVAPVNVYAPIGLAVAELIAAAGGATPDCSRWVLGGPVSGQAITDLGVRIDKGSLCVLGLTQSISDTAQPTLPCINCGYCVSVCPAQLLPQQLFKLAQHGEHTQAKALGMMDCIECGLCAEVCPSHLPLLDTYRHSKDWLRAQAQDERAQQRAKRRFDARQARIEKDQAERQARRQARAERLQSQTSAQSEIEAALARTRAKKANPDTDGGQAGERSNNGEPST